MMIPLLYVISALLAGCIETSVEAVGNEDSADTCPSAGTVAKVSESEINVADSCWTPSDEWAPSGVGTVLELDASPMRADAVIASRFIDINDDGSINGTDPMQMAVVWLHPNGEGEVHIYSHEGDSLAVPKRVFDAAYVVAGDWDPAGESGTELQIVSIQVGVESILTSAGLVDSGWSVDIDEIDPVAPSMVAQDSVAGVLLVNGRYIFDQSGAVVLVLDDSGLGDSIGYALPVDLNGDGDVEYIGTEDHGNGIHFFDGSGDFRRTCLREVGGRFFKAVAPADVDADGVGELVAFGDGRAVRCTSEGELELDSSTNVGTADMVAVVQLDEDAFPEFVLGDRDYIYAFSHEFEEAWRTARTGGGGCVPLSGVDLDGDGRHEILAMEGEMLNILSPQGESLLHVGNAGSSTSCGRQPVVADIDADGLAELVVSTGSTLRVMEPLGGGWRVKGAEFPWSGRGRRSGDRGLAGEVSDLGRGSDGVYFNALEPGAPAGADIGVEIVDVCRENCGGDSVVTMNMWNSGAADVDGPVVLSLVAGDDTLVWSHVIDEIRSGQSLEIVAGIGVGLEDGSPLSLTFEGGIDLTDCGSAQDQSIYELDECLH